MAKSPRTSVMKNLTPHFQTKVKSAPLSEIPTNIINDARQKGEMNLSKRGLSQIPSKVWCIESFDEEELKHLELRFDVEREEWWSPVPLHTLDLSLNCIQELPSDVQHLHALTHLNMDSNSLTQVPEEIGCLTHLTHLTLSRNRLTHLPSGFYRLTQLQHLNLSQNLLTAVDADVACLIELTYLDVSSNSLTELTPDVGFLTRLTELRVAHNQLSHIPADLTNLRALRRLDLSHNEITSLPELGELRKMEVLCLEHNQLTCLPRAAGCVALKELDLASNLIKELDAECLEALTNIRVLNLERNQVSEIPEEIQLLLQLQRLNLNNNKVILLPACLGCLPRLQTLQVSDNPITNVRRDIVCCGTQRIIRFLRQATDGATNIRLTHTPQPVTPSDDYTFPDRYSMKANKALSVVNQGLTTIPDSVFEEATAVGVMYVDLARNQLQQVPDGLSALEQHVTELNLSVNLLTCIPASVARCDKLQYLTLQKNALVTLPDELATLLRLKELNISCNKFVELPVCVYGMKGLEILIASDNQITCLDASGLSRLTRLATLDLRNNNINCVPPQLGQLVHIKLLELSGNSFRTPNHACLAKGTDHVMAYLRDRIAS